MPSIVVVYTVHSASLIEVMYFQGTPEVLASLKYCEELNKLAKEAAEDHHKSTAPPRKRFCRTWNPEPGEVLEFENQLTYKQ